MDRWCRLALAAVLTMLLAGCGGSKHPAAAKAVKAAKARPPAATPANASPVASAPRFDPQSFTAVSENDFWLLGTVPCGARRCSSILRTSDGGGTFATLAAPKLPAEGTVPQLRFSDHDDGFAFVPMRAVFYSTHDGGASWRRLRLRSVLAFATGGGDAYLVTASCTNTGCKRYTFLRSSVSRDAWTSARVPFLPDGSLVDLAAHGGSLWLLATPAGSNPRNDELARSSDGGRSFATVRGPCYAGLGGDLEPVSAQVVWAVCPTGMMAEAARSTDGGVTFRALRTPPLVNSAALATASADTAVLARNGARSPLLRTTDGGRTWRRAGTPPGGVSVSFAGFTDARVGVALVQTPSGRQTLWRTTDGGARWYTVPLP